MLLKIDGNIKNTKETNYCENGNYLIWWEGLIFIPGILSGRDSIKYFVDLLNNSDLSSVTDALSGIFSCILFDKKKKEYYAFTDNSRCTNIFYNSKCISTSFIELVKYSLPTKDDLDFSSIIEFVITGQIFCSNTFFNNIKNIRADEILVIDSKGISSRIKKLENIYEKDMSINDFLKEMKKIAFSLKNKKISIDLTGGIDTRLLSLIFQNAGLQFETAMSGVSGHPDIETPKEVSKILGLQYYITYHQVNSETLFKELKDTLICYDGLTDVIEKHREYQFFEDRKSRGIEVSISGLTGQLYKDQNTWRAAAKTIFKTNWKKILTKDLVYSGLVGWGFDPKLPCFLFSNKYKSICLNYKNNLYSHILHEYSYNNRFKMSDKILYEYSVRTARIRYSPLLERKIVPYGISMDWKDRLLARNYRKIITKLNKPIARIKTTRANTSISSEFGYIISDIIKICNYLIFFKIRRNKEMLNFDDRIYAIAKQIVKNNHYIDCLKNIGLLDHDLKIVDIPNKYIGRIITLGMLVEFIWNK